MFKCILDAAVKIVLQISGLDILEKETTIVRSACGWFVIYIWKVDLCSL